MPPGIAALASLPVKVGVTLNEVESWQAGSVIGPSGEPTTLTSLLPPHRKAEVVAAANGCLLIIDEVCGRYSVELK